MLSTPSLASVSKPAETASLSDVGTSVFNQNQVLSTPQATGNTHSASEAALSFIDRHSDQWGVTAQEVRQTKVLPGAGGLSTVRYVETLAGMDVLGSRIAVTLNRNLAVSSFEVTTLAGVDVDKLTPVLTKVQAQTALKALVVGTSGASTQDVSVTELHPVVASSHLVAGIPSGLHIAWSAWTASTADPTSMSICVLDDATSSLLYSTPLVHHITYTPNICDLQSAVPSEYATQSTALGSTGLVRSHNNHLVINAVGDLYPLCGTAYTGRNTPSSVTALNNINATWNFYKNVIGIDINEEKWLGNISSSLNGDRNPRISAFTNVCLYDTTNGYSDCPNYGNAFWSPWSAPKSICRSGACSGIFMGAGYDQALDVIAHELTHGITFSISFTQGFSDTSDAAAMSEGLSDVFGEAAERLSPTSQPDPTWQVGEGVAGADPGPYRVMKTGTSYSSPDSPTAVPAITKSWVVDDGHVNNGPLNRFAWLIANGATVGSTKINALGTVPADGVCHVATDCTGISRMAVLMYQTLPALTSSSTYFALGQAVMNACQTLVNNQVAGFTADACGNVAKALKVTGISKFTITNLTKVTYVPKSSTVAISASAQSYAGAKVALQPMRLEQLVKGVWVTVAQADAACKRYCTDVNGQVKFSFKVKKATRYRISADSNYGAMQAQTPSYALRVY